MQAYAQKPLQLDPHVPLTPSLLLPPQVHGKPRQSNATASIASHTWAVCLGAMEHAVHCVGAACLNLEAVLSEQLGSCRVETNVTAQRYKLY
jgi:hypothetical protein